MPAFSSLVVVGCLRGVFGVRGWVRVKTYTTNPPDILRYKPWYLERDQEWHEFVAEEGRMQTKGLVARLRGLDNPEQAAPWALSQVAVDREQLPALANGQYYWKDLEGLRVLNLAGVDLGKVSYLFETGANPILVVEGERRRLIPYIKGSVVQTVDLPGRLITVDWDPDF